ncbi:MAG: STAS domain-containing protein [Anaerolineae bacterium]|jgi:anti-anti-sigma factor
MAIDLTISTAQGRVPVTVLHPRGDLDASNYQDLIAEAQTAFDNGARDVLLDLSEIRYVSSSGLVALQSIAALLRGDPVTDTSQGWGALHAVSRDREVGLQQHFKLLKPQPRVQKVLNTVGFERFLQTFDDLEAAVASF